MFGVRVELLVEVDGDAMVDNVEEAPLLTGLIERVERGGVEGLGNV